MPCLCMTDGAGCMINSAFVRPDTLELAFVLSSWDYKSALQLQIKFRLPEDTAESGAELHSKPCLLFLILYSEKPRPQIYMHALELS